MSFNKIRVLLIDDDEDDYANIRGILSEIQRAKYDLTWKPTFEEGIKALQSGGFDVCLLDYRLGELTGLDLLRESRSLNLQTPVIFLTGQVDFDLDVLAMQSGAADYLIKNQISAPLLERSIRYSMKNALDMKDLAEQRENFQVLFNSTFEGIVVHQRGEIADANAAAGLIFGRQPVDMVDTFVTDYVRADFHEELKAHLNSAVDWQLDVAGVRTDGADIRLNLTGRTILLRGQKTSLLAIRDMTQQRQMEAQILQQDRLASLGLLASSLAHEIGTPLGVIRGRAEMVGKNAEPKLRETMELMITQIDRISKLVKSLLQIARGAPSENAADVDVAAVIHDVTNLMSHELERNSIELVTQVPAGTMARAEAGPLGQVFLNLMVNSVHAIESARKSGRMDDHKIELICEPRDKKVQIQVRDTGCGIAEKNLRHLFKPFFTTKDIGLGTGLGLATSYRLVQSWQGGLSVESREGAGATFTIVLNRA